MFKGLKEDLGIIKKARFEQGSGLKLKASRVAGLIVLISMPRASYQTSVTNFLLLLVVQ